MVRFTPSKRLYELLIVMENERELNLQPTINRLTLSSTNRPNSVVCSSGRNEKVAKLFDKKSYRSMDGDIYLSEARIAISFSFQPQRPTISRALERQSR